MNKILGLAILIGLTGTASIAAPTINLEALPTDVQAKIKSAQDNAAKTADPVSKFVDDAEKYGAGYKTEVQNVFSQYPYLQKNPTAQNLKTIIEQTGTAIDSDVTALKRDLPEAQSLQASLATAETAYNSILDLVFPAGCKTYNGDKIQGWIMPKLGRTSEYALYKNPDNHEGPIAELLRSGDIYDVGQIGTGKEFTPSIAKYSQVMAQLIEDKNGRKAVACLALLLAPPSAQGTPKLTPGKK